VHEEKVSPMTHDDSVFLEFSLHLTSLGSAAAAEEEKDEEASEDFQQEEAEDEDEEADSSFEGVEEEENIENIPPPIIPTMKVVSKKPAAAAGASSNSPFCMNVFFPHILYTYIEDGLRRVTIDFLVFGQSKESFRPKVISDGTVFQLGMVIPPFFVKEDRLMQAYQRDQSFTEDTHKATALQEVVGRHTAHLDIEEPVMADPMQVKLPFKCEEDIAEWEMIAYDNEDAFNEEVGTNQYFFVLAVTLTGVDKVKKCQKAGKFRNLGTKSSPGHGMDEDEWLVFSGKGEAPLWGGAFMMHDSSKEAGSY